MKQTFDTDSILYKVINSTTGITSVLTGGVYVGERPLNSTLEDIVINTITLTQDYLPQLGTSNVNIHVTDVNATIKGVTQKVANRARLSQLSSLVLDALRAARITGLKWSISSMNTIQEADISQHYVNIRIDWNINN